MQMVRQLVALVLCSALAAGAQGNTWNKVRYNGGTLQTKVDPKAWDNHLTVTSEMITLRLKDGQTIEILPSWVTGLSYGQEAHRRTGTMIALSLISLVALFGLFHKTRLHFIGIEYTTADNKKSALLLQGHKDNYRAILVALRGATGAPVAVAEEDRKYVPVGVETTVAKGKETEKSAGPTELVTVQVTANPENAEVFVDGAFVGNAPTALKLTPGKHTIRVVMPGYKEWIRELSVLSGTDAKVTAILEKTS